MTLMSLCWCPGCENCEPKRGDCRCDVATQGDERCEPCVKGSGARVLRNGPGKMGAERLARFLAWRRVEKKVPETPARHSLPYVGPIAWLGFGVLTVALVAAGQRPGRTPVPATLRPASAEITGPLTPVEPAALTAERAATASAASVSANGDPYVRSERSAWSAPSGRKALSAPASVRRPGVRHPGTAAPPVAASRLTATVATARRWVGYMPEANEAIVRWVKSQPPPDGRRLAEPDRPQTR